MQKGFGLVPILATTCLMAIIGWAGFQLLLEPSQPSEIQEISDAPSPSSQTGSSDLAAMSAKAVTEKELTEDTSVSKESAGVQTDSWQIYTNKKYNYSITNPGGKVLLTGDENSDNVKVGDVRISVSQSNPENCRGDCPSHTQVADFSNGELKGRKIEGKLGNIGGMTPQAYQEIVIPHNNLFYIFSIYEFNNSFDPDVKEGEAKYKIPDEKIAFLEQLLKNFKFLE